MLLVSLGGKCGKIKAKYTLIHLGNLIVHHAELAISVLGLRNDGYSFKRLKVQIYQTLQNTGCFYL